jgi:CheY-like chemotaxis protein
VRSRDLTPPTILLVEDHDDTREIFQAVLEAAGYSVVAVDTPRDALERVRVVQVDLVIMDLGVHGEGLNLAARLASLPKAPKLIAVTGRDRQGVPGENLFVEYLLKPVLPEDLVQVVRRVLSRG